jgi:cell division protein FtsW (lipid II flippase)
MISCEELLICHELLTIPSEKDVPMHVARRSLFLALMLILQAVVAGVLLMFSAQVPWGLMATQTAAALLMLPLSFLVAFFAGRATLFGERIFLFFVATTLLFVATRGCDIEGMHRWICVGPLRLQQAARVDMLLPHGLSVDLGVRFINMH